MKLDKRVIECGALTAYMSFMAVATSVAQTTVPVCSNEVSTKIYEEAEAYASADTSWNAGIALSLDCENYYVSAGEKQISEPSIAPNQTEVVASVPVSEWANKVMAKVDEYVNIRTEANGESEILGKLYKGSAADIIERGNEWTKISSGSVQGFIKNEFLAFDGEAEALANEEGTLVTTILTDTLRVRQEASADSAVVGLVGTGDELTAVEPAGDSGFIAVEYKGQTAYVATEFASVELKLGKAVSIEEEQAALAAEREAKAAKASEKAVLAVQYSSGSSVTQSEAVAASYDETSLLAALIYCEAGGQSYEGKLAVGAVVMNRVRSGSYPNTITDVIYQRGQFTPALNGKVERILNSGSYSGDCYAAAQEAISGVSNIGGAIGFGYAGGAPSAVIDGVAFY